MEYGLNRFKVIQEKYHLQVLQEMKNGKKASHWMWFMFPQIIGLGKSGIAKRYEIADFEEAKLYLQDESLSKRLIELTKILVEEVDEKTAEEIFGDPDYLKFHSSMTLFYSVVMSDKQFQKSSDYFCFEAAIKKYYNGNLDELTLEILKSMP